MKRTIKIYLTITLATSMLANPDQNRPKTEILSPLKTEQMESFGKYLTENSTSGQISYPYVSLSTNSIRVYGHHEQAYEVKNTNDYFWSRMQSLKVPNPDQPIPNSLINLHLP